MKPECLANLPLTKKKKKRGEGAHYEKKKLKQTKGRLYGIKKWLPQTLLLLKNLEEGYMRLSTEEWTEMQC